MTISKSDVAPEKEIVSRLDSVLVEIAEEHQLALAPRSVFGRINGVIVAINLLGMEGEQYSFNVNLNHLSELERKEIKNKLLKPKPKSMVRGGFNSTTGCLMIQFQKPLFRGEKAYRKNFRDFVERLIRSVSPGPEGEIELYNGFPILVSQLPQVEENLAKSERTITQRFVGALMFASAATFVIFLASLNPYSKKLALSPVLFFFYLLFPIYKFIRGVKGRSLVLKTEFLALTLMICVCTLMYVLTIGYCTIPPNFHKTFELTLLVIQTIDTPNWLFIAFFAAMLIFASFTGIRAQKGQLKAIPVNTARIVDLEYSKISDYNTRISMIFMFVELGMAIYILLSNVPDTVLKDSVELTRVPICLVVLTGHSIIATFIYLSIRSNQKLKKYFQINTPEVKKADLLATLILLPIFLSFSFYPSIISFNFKMDKNPGEKRTGIVSSSPLNSHLEACYQVNDLQTGHNLGFEACPSKVGDLSGGETLSYFFKPGALHTGIIYNMKVEQADSWEKLLKQLGSTDKIRSKNINALMANPRAREEINSKLIPEWKAKCAMDIAEACRFLTYVTTLKKSPVEYVSLLHKACDLGDYISCYNFSCLNISNDQTVSKFETLAMKACTNGEAEACDEYLALWGNSMPDSRRANVQLALSQLCAKGRYLSCDRLVWEKNRI